MLIALCALNWLGALFDFVGHHPQNDIPPGPLVAGFVFFGLNALVQARRRFLYLLAIIAIASFVVSGLIQARSSLGSIVEIPYTILVLLLLIGWRRYMVLIAQDRRSFEDSHRRMIFGQQVRQIGPDHQTPCTDGPNPS